MTGILVSGASVAGPALAWWLRRYGFEPTVVERAPALRDGGQAIDLRGAAREVAERMGIMSDIRRAHTGTCGMSLVDEAGRRLASMGADLLAYVLAGELAAAGEDYRAAFARYESEMRGYVKRGQEQAKGASGFLLPKSRREVWLRNQFIRMLPYMPWRGLVAGGVQKAASAITLKDYRGVYA